MIREATRSELSENRRAGAGGGNGPRGSGTLRQARLQHRGRGHEADGKHQQSAVHCELKPFTPRPFVNHRRNSRAACRKTKPPPTHFRRRTPSSASSTSPYFEMFVPGLKRGYAIIPLIHRRGETEDQRREDVQATLQKVRHGGNTGRFGCLCLNRRTQPAALGHKQATPRTKQHGSSSPTPQAPGVSHAVGEQPGVHRGDALHWLLVLAESQEQRPRTAKQGRLLLNCTTGPCPTGPGQRTRPRR